MILALLRGNLKVVLIALAFSLTLGLAVSLLLVGSARAQRTAVPPPEFLIVATRLDTGERLDQFIFSRVPTPDLEPRADGVRGMGKWSDGDRVAYRGAYAFWLHEDPGNHDFLQAFRFFVVIYEANPPGFPLQINDKFMAELVPGGGLPYPYEKPTGVVPLDASHPGASFEFYHLRPPSKVSQLLARFTVPSVSSVNPTVRWWYHGNGTVLGTVAGVIKFKVIMSAMSPFYVFCVAGVPTEGCVD